MTAQRYVLLTHDPFARGSVARCVNTDQPHNRSSCAWCGSKPARFIYGWEDDARGRPVWDTRAFCSLGCRTAYHS